MANASTPVSLGVAGAIAVGNTLEAVIGMRLRRWLTNRLVLQPFEEMVSWLGAAGTGAVALHLGAGVPAARTGEIAFTWWAGDAAGILVVAPAILALRGVRWADFTGRAAAKLGLLTVAAAVSGMVFAGRSGSSFLFAIFPLLLLATMSHEICTPMNGVIGYADLLMDSPLNPEQKGWARIIRSSGRSLLTIINDILDFSKIEAGKLQLESVPFGPAACIRDVIDILCAQADQKGLELSFDGLGAPGPVLGDPTRFRQILLNLVSNGLKFTEAGSVRISMYWDGDEASGRLNIAVADSGIGIPEENQARLFHRFSQVDSSTTRRFGGTGLGLAICKHLVGLMGGEIGVRSVVGAGTTVHFEIPFDVAIVALTAAALDEDRGKCFAAGMDDYITKPFVREDFIRTLSRWAAR